MLKDKMRDICAKLPRTPNGDPDYESGKKLVKWPFYKALLFMKGEFTGRDMQAIFHDASTAGNNDSQLSPLEEAKGDRELPNQSPAACLDVRLKENKDLGPPSKKTRFTEDFFTVEKEKMKNFNEVFFPSEKPKDEWSAFCSAIVHDLRKLKDPFLIMQTKADLNRIVSEAVFCQLQKESSCENAISLPVPSPSSDIKPLNF